MSILIKGMEMPTDNTILLRIYPQNDGVFYVEQLDIDDDILDKYWAVSVPEHGRLIDEQWLKDAMITTLEALKKNPKMDRQEMHLIAAFDTLRVMVDDAPTIIPAEEGERWK